MHTQIDLYTQRLAILGDRHFIAGEDMCEVTRGYQHSMSAGRQYVTIMCICFVGMMSSADTKQTAVSRAFRCKVQTAGLLASLPAGIPLAAVVADLRKPEGHAGAGQIAEQLLKTDQAAAVQRQA